MREQIIRYRWLFVVLIVAACLAFTSGGDELSSMILAYQNGDAPVDTLRIGQAWVDSIYCRGYRLGWSLRSSYTETVTEEQRIVLARNHLPDSSLIFLAVYVIGFRDGETGRPNRVRQMQQNII